MPKLDGHENRGAQTPLTLQKANVNLWAIAEVQLSPLEIREDRKDLYALKVVQGSLKLLSEVPDGWLVNVTGKRRPRPRHGGTEPPPSARARPRHSRRNHPGSRDFPEPAILR
jgi:hypothetical protein